MGPLVCRAKHPFRPNDHRLPAAPPSYLLATLTGFGLCSPSIPTRGLSPMQDVPRDQESPPQERLGQKVPLPISPSTDALQSTQERPSSPKQHPTLAAHSLRLCLSVLSPAFPRKASLSEAQGPWHFWTSPSLYHLHLRRHQPPPRMHCYTLNSGSCPHVRTQHRGALCGAS